MIYPENQLNPRSKVGLYSFLTDTPASSWRIGSPTLMLTADLARITKNLQ